MATPQEIKDLIAARFPDNQNQEISESDLREVTTAIVDLAGAATYDDLNIEWDIATTYDQDEICSYLDRLWKSKVGSNTGNQPPSDPNTTSDAYWEEQSKSSSNPVVEWQPGVYGSGLIVVLRNSIFYKLQNSNRPYYSHDFEAELAQGDWSALNDQTIKKVSLRLDHFNLQTAGTTPIEIIPDPGTNKAVQIVGATAHYQHNGTDYSNASTIRLWYKSGIGLSSESGFISSNQFLSSSTEIYEQLLNVSFGRVMFPGEGLEVSLDADAVGEGGPVDIHVQYVIIELASAASPILFDPYLEFNLADSAQLVSARAAMLSEIFNGSVPGSYSPDADVAHVTDFHDVRIAEIGYYSEVRKLTYTFTDWNSETWTHYVYKVVSNQESVRACLHLMLGHGSESGTSYEEYITLACRYGVDVMVYAMPEATDSDNSSTYDFGGSTGTAAHDKFKAQVETGSENPLEVFFYDKYKGIKHVASDYDVNYLHGLSGGAWSVYILGAIMTEIDFTIANRGGGPRYYRSSPEMGDYELGGYHGQTVYDGATSELIFDFYTSYSYMNMALMATSGGRTFHVWTSSDDPVASPAQATTDDWTGHLHTEAQKIGGSVLHNYYTGGPAQHEISEPEQNLALDYVWAELALSAVQRLVLNGDNSDEITTFGGNVTAWDDESGVGIDFTGGSPDHDNTDKLTFVASNSDYLEAVVNANLRNLDRASVVLVVEVSSSTSCFFWVGIDGGNANNRWAIFSVANKIRLVTNNNSGTQDQVELTDALSDGDYVVSVLADEDNGWKIRINGVEEGLTVTIGSNTGKSFGGQNQSYNYDAASIGSQRITSPTYHDTVVKAYRVLARTEISKVQEAEDELNTKYSVF